jgi:TatD DNase family protein
MPVKTNMFDTHCHLTFPQFEGRVDALLDEAKGAGVRGCISVSTTSDDAQKALALARTHDNVWCTAGVHPLYADEPTDISRDWNALRTVAQDRKCVAWGELGLDNHYEQPAHDTQVKLLEEELEFLGRCATEGLHKPIIVHCRDAFDDLLPVFRASGFPSDRFVFHCFTGTPADARKALDFGAMISFTGIVTFSNAREIAEAAKIVPDDRIMVETDAPYLSPEPVRTVRPNVPAHVVHTARFLAQLRGVDFATFEKTVDGNAQRFFGIEF